jgi:Flp pilus assembly protein TadG
MRKFKFINRKGQVIILVTLAVVLLLLLVGLALDSGIGYAVKAKLNSAVDAAAIAAGRALSEGSSDAERMANANAAALTFFNANFPANYLRATVTSGPTVVTDHDPTTGEWHITVSASAQVPTYFLRIRGNNSFSASSTSMALKRDVDMILVLDCSGSLDSPPSPAGTFNALKDAAKEFIDKFNGNPGGDRIGLVTFASGAQTSVAINKDATRGFTKGDCTQRQYSYTNPSSICGAINALTVGGATDSEEAMRRAKEELDLVPAGIRSSLRIIVFFSDGAPNTVAGNFDNGGSIVLGDLYSETSSGSPPNRLYVYSSRNTFLGYYGSISVLPTTDYTGIVPVSGYRTISPAPGNAGSNTRCNVNKAARNMLENVANMARNESPPVHVYTLGLGADLTTLEITFCGYGPNEHGENILMRLANAEGVDTHVDSQPTGLYVYAADASGLTDAFNRIAAEIFRLTR